MWIGSESSVMRLAGLDPIRINELCMKVSLFPSIAPA